MILGIETSTRNCSVVLWDNQGNFFLKEKSSSEFVHAEELHSMISGLISEAKVDWSMLESVVVGRGPGSYTGLRIGVSCAKGICFSLNIPLYSISSLTLMVLGNTLAHESQNVLSVMDARRMEVFGGRYQMGELIGQPEALVFEDPLLIAQFKDLEWVVGENASKLSSVLSGNTGFIDAFPSAKEMMHKKASAFFRIEDLAYFEPEYVKPFIPTVSKK
jgi:tRNA threonylcarbamoyladenosine biosynthesis protein TsaB